MILGLTGKHIQTFEIFVWKDLYETGIEEIDIKHKRIVEILNELGAKYASRSDHSSFAEQIGSLKDLIIYTEQAKEAFWSEHLAKTEFPNTYRLKNEKQCAWLLESTKRLSKYHSDQDIECFILHLTNWLFENIFLADIYMTNAVFQTEEQKTNTGLLRDIECNDQYALRNKQNELFVDTFNSLISNNLRFYRMLSDKEKNEALSKEKELLLESIIKNEPECIKLVSSEGILLDMNPAGLNLVQAEDKNQVVGKCVFDLINDEYRQAFIALHQDVLKGEKKSLVFKLDGLQGSTKWLETHAVPMQINEKTVHLAVTRDVTQQILDNRALKLSASVFESANEGILICDTDFIVIDSNLHFKEMTSYSSEETSLNHLEQLIWSNDSCLTFNEVKRQVEANNIWKVELVISKKNGSLFPAIVTISAVSDKNNEAQLNHFIVFIVDHSSQKEYQNRLEYMAHFDTLTGLPNRILMADRIQQAIASSRREKSGFALVYLDLDSFKPVNDTFGHDAGDEILKVISTRLLGVLRESDTLSRFGGDEFIILMRNIQSNSEQVVIFERILQTVNKPITYNGDDVCVSASIGVTYYTGETDVDGDQLIRQADQAMYQAKLKGKDTLHVFDIKLYSSLKFQNAQIDTIRNGLKNNEFELYYQPKINMATGLVVGAEALIRWNSPTEGLLSPASFLPLIEKDLLSIDVDNWVMRTALDQISAWLEQDLEIPVSINISPIHLQSSDFFRNLRNVLTTHSHIDTNLIELEVLESSAIEDIETVSYVMRKCIGLGVSFSLDDFGTGYSSLSYLKRLPIRTLKIDQSFVRDMLVDPEDLNILEGIISLANLFNIKTVAEGVESSEHLAALVDLGCYVGQGYGIARPMPAAQFTDWYISYYTKTLSMATTG